MMAAIVLLILEVITGLPIYLASTEVAGDPNQIGFVSPIHVILFILLLPVLAVVLIRIVVGLVAFAVEQLKLRRQH